MSPLTRSLIPLVTAALLSLPSMAAAAEPLALHSRALEGEPAGGAGEATPAGPAAEGASTTDEPAEEPPEPSDAESTPATPETTPAEGPAPDPEDDGYTSSRESGQAISGQDRQWKDAPSDKETVGVKEEKRLHHHMAGLVGVAAGVGWGLITAGDKYCGEFSEGSGDADGRKSVCTDIVPAFLDISAGFGAAKRLDIVVAVRINLMKRAYDDSACDGGVEACAEGEGLFVDGRGIGVLPGVRLWGRDNNKIFKVGGAIDLLYMYENFDGYRNRPSAAGLEDADPDNAANEDGVSDHILGLRGGPIIQIDPHHNVGIFIIPAAVPSFRPGGEPGTDSGWFEIGFEGSVGVQARFP